MKKDALIGLIGAGVYLLSILSSLLISALDIWPLSLLYNSAAEFIKFAGVTTLFLLMLTLYKRASHE